MSRECRFIQFMFLILCMSVTAYADVKIKSRQTMQGQTNENTTYIKGKRQRSEQNNGGMEMVNITQCDLRRELRIMPGSKTYMIESYDRADGTKVVTPTAAQTTADSTQSPTQPKQGGVITTTYTAKDTGERKQMFGYTARHIITTMETESSPDACIPLKSKMQTDGWYIDAAFALDCDTDRYKGYLPKSDKPGCQDRYETKQMGAAKTGYPVWVKMTMFDDSGKESYTMLNEVVELSKAALDAAMFDVPADFREVKTSSELYASAASPSAASTSDRTGGTLQITRTGNEADGNATTNNLGVSANVRNLSKPISNLSTEVGAKKQGVVHLGLTMVKTGSVGEGMNADELSSAIGNTLAEYLKAPNFELVQLEARLPSQIGAEAKQKECDYVIYTNVSHKKGGGGGGMFGKMLGNVAGSAVSHVGYGSNNVASAVAGHVASTAIYTAASMSANVKSKDELQLEVKLQTPSNATPMVVKQFKAKAKSDGEDIISPLIEQAAQTILDAAARQ